MTWRSYMAGSFGVCTGQGRDRSRYGIAYWPESLTAKNPAVPGFWRFQTAAGRDKTFATREAAQHALDRLNLPYLVQSFWMAHARKSREAHKRLCESGSASVSLQRFSERGANSADPFRLYVGAAL